MLKEPKRHSPLTTAVVATLGAFLAFELITHLAEVYEIGLPTTGGKWLSLGLTLFGAGYLVKDVAEKVRHFRDLQAQRHLAMILSALVWLITMAGAVLAGSDDGAGTVMLCGFMMMFATGSWAKKTDDKIAAQKAADQRQAEGGLQLEFELWKGWDGQLRYRLPESRAA